MCDGQRFFEAVRDVFQVNEEREFSECSGRQRRWWTVNAWWGLPLIRLLSS